MTDTRVSAKRWRDDEFLVAQGQCLPARSTVNPVMQLWAAPDDGINQPSFNALLELLETGHCWVKLSAAYRVAEAPPYAEMKPFVDAMLAVNQERLLWERLPHVAFKGRMPNTADLFDQMLTWVPDESTRTRILVDNPARLYRFNESAR